MNRISEVRKQHGYSQAALGRAINRAQNTICNWENGNREPDNESLLRLSSLFGVSVDYLLGKSDTPAASQQKGVKIPVLGRVVAGIPIEAVEEILDYEEISADMAAHGEYFALQVFVQSMEPKFSEGDVVIVKRQPDVDSGDIAIVMINGDEATIKKVKKLPDGIMLIASNTTVYEPTFYSKKEIDELPVVILGKVVELRAKF